MRIGAKLMLGAGTLLFAGLPAMAQQQPPPGADLTVVPPIPQD